MVTQIIEYTSAQAIADALDKQLSETKSVLGEYLRKLDEIRTLAEKSKKVREVAQKFARIAEQPRGEGLSRRISLLQLWAQKSQLEH